MEGRLKLDQWDDKQTDQKRSKLGWCWRAFNSSTAATAAKAALPKRPGARAAGSGRCRSGRCAAAAPEPEAPPPEEDDVPF